MGEYRKKRRLLDNQNREQAKLGSRPVLLLDSRKDLHRYLKIKSSRGPASV